MTKKYIICISLVCLISIVSASAEMQTIRFAYFEAGDYYLNKAFSKEFKAQIKLLKSDSLDIVFEPYGYKSAEWNRQRCQAMARDLARMKNIDMVLAVGAWVVEDLIAAGFDKPIIALGQYAVWERELVNQAGRPVVDNLTINVQPNQIDRDIQLLCGLFSPGEIGLFYFPSGDEYGRVKNRVENAAARYGAKVIAPFDTTLDGKFSHFGSYSRYHHDFDVLYLPPLWSMQLEQMNQFFENARYDRLPTVTAEGLLIVEKGAAVAGQLRSYVQLARFSAHKVLNIIDGATPADLPTIYDAGQHVCFNETTLNKLNKSFPRNVSKGAVYVAPGIVDTIPVFTLNKAIDQALRENAGLMAKKRLFRKTSESAKQAFTRYMPSLEIMAGIAGADEKRPASVYNPVLNRKTFAGIYAEQTIFSYDALKDISIARKNIELAGMDSLDVKRGIRQAVTGTYLSTLAAENRLKKIEELIARLRGFRANARLDALFSGGDTSNVLIYSGYLAELDIMKHQARSDMKISKSMLNTLINRPVDWPLELDRSEFQPEVMAQITFKYNDYISDERRQRALNDYFTYAAIGNSVELNKYSLRIDAQRQKQARNNGWYFPELSLRAGYSVGKEFEHFNDDDSHRILSIGGVLKWPLKLWGDRQYAGRALEYEMESLRFAKDSLRFKTAENVSIRLSEFLSLIDIVPVVYDIRRTLKTSLDDVYMAYSKNQSDITDIAFLFDKYIDAELSVADILYEFYGAYYSLMDAAGSGYMAHGSEEENKFYLELEQHLGIK